jgi:hypothetical protein
LRLVISQPDAALYIQLPTFETTVAVHSTVKVAWRNGLQADVACSVAVAVEFGPVLMRRSRAEHIPAFYISPEKNA